MMSNEGKLIWGTSRYRLKIELEEPSFHINMKGTIALLDRRFLEEELSFSNAEQFIQSFKKLWSKALNREIQEAQYSRLARWIEEFFQEQYDVNVDFQEILNFIRSGIIKKVPTVTEKIEEKIVPKDEIQDMIQIEDDVFPTSTRLVLKDDLQEDMIDSILDSVFQKEAPKELPMKITSSISFKDEEGNERNISQDSSVIPPLGSNDFKVNTNFKNPIKGFIKDIQLVDTFPFDFNVKSIKSSDIPNVTHEKDVTSQGLQIKWNIPLLAEGQNFEAKYSLGLRITRLIVAQLPDEIIKLKTYESIQEDEGYYKISPIFINSFEHPIKKLRIADYIPRIYKLVEIEPEPQEPFGKLILKPRMIEAIWNHENISPGTSIERYYELEHAPTFYRSLIYLYPKKKELNPLIIGRVFYPESDGSIQVFYQVLNPDLKIQHLSIKDVFPKSINIEFEKTSEQNALIEGEETKTLLLSGISLQPQDEYVIQLKVTGELDIEPSPMQVYLNEKHIPVVFEKKSQFTEKQVL